MSELKKTDPSICCLQNTCLRCKDTHTLEVKGWKRVSHTNGNQKKVGVAILTTDKIDVKIKGLMGDKDGHYVMIKGS